jgi:hypothetical protein
LQPLLQPQDRQHRPLGVILLSRREAKHHQHPLAHHALDGPAISLCLMLHQVVQRVYQLMEGVEVRRLPRL